MKNNYDKELLNLIADLDYTPKLLLHSCCGPCSSYVISFLSNYFDITIVYYNPNIEPKSEYEHRKREQLRLIKEIKTKNKLDFIDSDYDNNLYREFIKGLETEPEGGKRCIKCFQLRLDYTASLAHKLNYDYFGTTLSVSPYKNALILNNLGNALEKKYHVKWLVSDFKKRDGYKKSIELSKEYNLYRQHYCGCLFSIDNEND